MLGAHFTVFMGTAIMELPDIHTLERTFIAKLAYENAFFV